MKKLALLLMLFISVAASANSQNQQLNFFALTWPGGSSSGGSSGGSSSTGATIDSLTEGSVTNAATMDIQFGSFIAKYQYIYIIWDITPVTNNTNLQMLISANGSTWSSSYAYNVFFGSGSSSNASASVIALGTIYGGGTGEHSSGYTIVSNPNNAAYKPLVYGNIAELVASSGSNVPGFLTYSANVQAEQVTEAVRLYMSSGNITGTYKVFGMKN